VSAESYAEEQFKAALASPGFATRLRAAGADLPDDVVVVDNSTPIGEVLARLTQVGVVAVCDEDEPHGFAVGQLLWVAR